MLHRTVYRNGEHVQTGKPFEKCGCMRPLERDVFCLPTRAGATALHALGRAIAPAFRLAAPAHWQSPDYRNRVKRKMRAYHAFIQAGVVASQPRVDWLPCMPN
jgi:hypothetical protein